jgi:hypothetical protein
VVPCAATIREEFVMPSTLSLSAVVGLTVLACQNQAGGGDAGGETAPTEESGVGANTGGGSATASGGSSGDCGMAGSSGTTTDAGAAGVGGSGEGPDDVPVFVESCEPAASPEPVFDQACSELPYYAVRVDETRRLTALAKNEGTGINNSGQVIGTWNPGSDLEEWRPWLWEDGVTTPIGSGDWITGYALRLNESGSVLGRLMVAGNWVAYRYSNATVELLEGLSAVNLNDRGDLVGATHNPPSAVVIADGETHSLRTSLGSVRPKAINNRREIVGSIDAEGTGSDRAFLFACGQFEALATPGATWSEALDLNERRQIVGVSRDASGAETVFLHQDGNLTTLFPYDHAAEFVAINERGEVVHGDYLLSGGHLHLIRDLVAHDSCWIKVYANDINDHGDIVGWGRACEDPGAIAPALVITQYPERYRRQPAAR